MNAEQIIRSAIPNADDAIIDYILWERTPFPCRTQSARELYLAAYRQNRAWANEIQLCDLCDNKVTNDGHVCDKCRSLLDSARGLV